MKDSSIENMVQGLRNVYMVHGNCDTWCVDVELYIACGNPLKDNSDISRLCKEKRIHIAKYDVMRLDYGAHSFKGHRDGMVWIPGLTRLWYGF